MTVCAGLRRLRRPCVRAVGGGFCGRAMTLLAEFIGVWRIQQFGVLRAVRGVASGATLGLDRSMFVDKWPGHLCVALGANQN